MMFLGCDREVRKVVHLEDRYRGGGLYILGKPGMGKSTLIVELMLLNNGYDHGLFFIDPHGDAIDDYIKYSEKKDIVKNKQVIIIS